MDCCRKKEKKCRIPSLKSSCYTTFKDGIDCSSKKEDKECKIPSLKSSCYSTFKFGIACCRKKEEKKCKIPEELLDHCYLHTYDHLFNQVYVQYCTAVMFSLLLNYCTYVLVYIRTYVLYMYVAVPGCFIHWLGRLPVFYGAPDACRCAHMYISLIGSHNSHQLERAHSDTTGEFHLSLSFSVSPQIKRRTYHIGMGIQLLCSILRILPSEVKLGYKIS